MNYYKISKSLEVHFYFKNHIVYDVKIFSVKPNFFIKKHLKLNGGGGAII